MKFQGSDNYVATQDLMLAVNRHYGRSDYLPCITWGARACGRWPKWWPARSIR